MSYQHTCTYCQQIRPQALAKHLRRIIHNQNRWTLCIGNNEWPYGVKHYFKRSGKGPTLRIIVAEVLMHTSAELKDLPPGVL